MFSRKSGDASFHRRYGARPALNINFRTFSRYCMAVCLGLLPLCAAAIPITGAIAKVVLCMTPSQNGMAIFNPILEYGNPIRYVRLGRPLLMAVDGIQYELDLDGAIEEAMAEWSAAVPALRFQAVSEGMANQKTWRVRLSSLRVPRLGSGYMRGTQAATANPELVFYNNGFLKAAGEFHLNVQFMRSMLLSNYLRFLLRQTAKHEVGHLLGFKHAPGVGDNEDEHDANGCPLQAVFNPDHIAGGPPIMARNLATTLRLMDGYYERRLQIEDIQIAPQEAAIARAVFEQPCPVNIEPDERAPSHEAPRCPSATRLVAPPMPAMSGSLMN
jgi:hypothetical protein